MQTQSRGRLVALVPLVVFLGIYLIGSLLAGDFYKISITDDTGELCAYVTVSGFITG